MKVSEILIEDKKILNEAWPVFLTFPVITAAITAVMTGWTLVEIVQFISKYNEDPDQITDEEWDNLFFDLLLIALPKYVTMGVIKLIPARLKRAGGQWVKKKITDRYKKLSKQKADKERAGASKAGPPNPKDLQQIRARERLRNIKARKKADDIVAALPEKIITGLKVGIGLNIVHDYYVKISELDEQWADYEAGDKTTKLFTDLPRDKAITVYNYWKKQYLGEFMSTVGVAVGGLAAGAALKTVGAWLGKLTGGGFTGGLLELSFRGAGTLLSLVGKAGFTWAMFTQTKSGQELLSNTLATAMGLIGGTTAYLSDLADKAVKELGEKIGVKVNTQPSLKQPTAQDDAEAKLSNKDYMAKIKSEPLALQKGTDPNNSKIIYIGGVQMTDKDGYQIASDDMIQDIKSKAAIHKVPDPTVGIKKKPG